MNRQGPMHLCLLVHCLTDPSSTTPLTHEELFIPVADVDALLSELASEGFAFGLPEDAGAGTPKLCSFTFDDGYANNALFLPLAEKYQLPFILFVSSLNIAEQRPFIWDAAGLSGISWRHWSADYRQMYARIDPAVNARLMSDANHRPFTVDELQVFAANPWTRLALHTHSHQPLVGRFLASAPAELSANLEFLRAFPHVMPRDLALPCGLYTPFTSRRLMQERLARIYTIDGGDAGAGERLIHRISLVNPQVGGSLMSQVRRSFEWPVRMRRKIANIRYSSRLLNP